MATINITARDTIPGTKYPIQKISYQQPDASGEMQPQVNEVYFRPDAVAVLITDSAAKKFLLARQFRLPTFLNGSENGFLVEACAGLIEDDETPQEAAHREVEEETGYPITELQKIGGVYSSAGGITEFVHLFTANYQSGSKHRKGGGNANEGENIELTELDFRDARRQLATGAIRDAKTMLLLQYYFLNE